MNRMQKSKAVALVDAWTSWLVNRGKQLQLARRILTKPADWRAKPENRDAWVEAVRIDSGIDDVQINSN